VVDTFPDLVEAVRAGSSTTVQEVLEFDWRGPDDDR